ncbi:MAG: PHP domain-containing protein, partial [Acidobacteriota bacterium]
MSGPDFVHVHVHSSYSLLEGALTIARLCELAKADKQPALALTDTDNMFGTLEFSEKMAGAGIQPIVGCALGIDFGDADQGVRAVNAVHDRPRVVMLAASDAGYRSLMRLNSRAFLETPPNEKPHLKLDWLVGNADGIIALTGGPGGPLDRAIFAGQSHLAASRLEALLRLFGDRLYIELQRHGPDRPAEPLLVELAYDKGVPLVAANEPYFATAQDYEAHDALICIAEGRFLAEGDRRQLTSEHRFKSRAEMVKLFADLPEALSSTVEIAQRCSFRPQTRRPILPRFSVGADGADVDEAS